MNEVLAKKSSPFNAYHLALELCDADLLKINKAVYNAGCSVTLLSEYQVREHGFVIDSVAAKHYKAPGIPGQQRLALNQNVHIPFQDRGFNGI